jgi:ABC-type methionine transport system ATPase subunit
MMMLLREIQHSLGMTVVMVAHERQVAERFAGRIAAVQDGKLTSNGVKS